MRKELKSRLTTKLVSDKRPLDSREYPLARDSRGSAQRAEIRRETPRVSAPRHSNRPVERGNTKPSK